MKSPECGLEPTPTFTDLGALFEEFKRQVGYSLDSEEGLAAAREAFARESLTGESKVGDVLAKLEARDPAAARQIRELLALSEPVPPRSPPIAAVASPASSEGPPLWVLIAIGLGIATLVAAVVLALH